MNTPRDKNITKNTKNLGMILKAMSNIPQKTIIKTPKIYFLRDIYVKAH